MGDDTLGNWLPEQKSGEMGGGEKGERSRDKEEIRRVGWIRKISKTCYDYRKDWKREEIRKIGYQKDSSKMDKLEKKGEDSEALEDSLELHDKILLPEGCEQR